MSIEIITGQIPSSLDAIFVVRRLLPENLLGES